DNPDRRGLRFSVPYSCRMSGIFALMSLSGDANIEVYNSDGVTIHETITLDNDIRSAFGAVGTVFRNLVTPLELTKDTFYWIILYPTTGTNIALYLLDVTDDGASEAMNAIDGGVNFHYTTVNGSPSVEGDYTQTLTRRPMIGLILDQLDNGVAVCDFPALGDVEKGVVFDDGSKTGTFKEPGIANVKEGVEYGANDTEFTGTYARNVVGIGTVVGQSTAGIITGG
ncbi:hypothetical protein LCGC14_2887360, partial [marine sediment metagenome]